MLPIDFLSQPIWQRLGLALLHFLWQGLLVAILAREIVRVFRIGHGTTRYAVYLFAFLAMAACPVGTFLMLGNRTQVDPARLASSLNLERLTGKNPQLPTAVSAEPKAITPNLVTRALDRPSEDITHAEPPLTITGSPEKIPLVTSLRDGFRNSLDAVLPWTIVVLVVGVIVLSFRLLLGFVGVSRWRRRLEQLPDSPKQRIICLSGRLGMRGFSRVFVSPFVRLPTAIGYFRPMILLPAAMLTQLPPEMLEAIIAHELAHIRRFDLWVNLMQRIVETLLFYHPVVWWLSNRLRNEREFCCDELAAKAAGNRRTYATALEYAGRAELAANRPALAVGLGQRKMAILARVRHVLGISSPPKRSRYWLAGVLTLAAAITLGIVAQIAVTGSDAKAKTISEPARQTTVRSADIDTIKKLAGQLAKMAWDEWTTALASAKALIEQQPAVEMHVFEPLFEPLFSKVGWGGIGRRESRTAADLLARIGKPTVGFLLEKLKSTEARQRWSAIQILTEIGEPDAPVLSAIRPLLSDKDDYVRRVAIESLGKLGENARPAAEDLKAAFNDTSVINQIFARAAYIRIGRSKPEHIRAIAKYLKSRDTKDEVGGGSAAAVAASVLGDLGPAAIIAAPDLIAALNHPQSQIRINAAHALGCIGADSNQAIDGLIDRLKNDTSRHIRRSAATSLGRIGRKAQDAIPVLAKALREADKESRNDRKTDRTGWWVAARAVGQIGGANAIPVLEESLKNNDPDIRSTAAKALEKIQQEAKTPPTPPDTQPVEKIGEPALANAATKAMESLPAQNSFRGITVSIKAKKSVYEPGSFFEIVIVGTISTDREHTMYNAYWDLKKPVPGRLFVYDEAGSQILEFYDPRHHIGSSTGATKSACRKYKPGETQQIFLRQYLLFDRSPDCPLPPGRYKVQLALNGLLLWEPQQYVAHDEVPQGLDQQMVAYSNVVDIEIRGKPAFQGKTLTQWIEALKDEDPYVRCLAAFTLGKLRDERALPALIEALKDKKSSVRRNAALALGELRDQTAIDPLIAALKKEQSRELISIRPGSAREGMRLALLKIGKVDVEPFIKRLEKGDGEVRTIIIGVLAELKTKRAVEPLIPLLKDYSWGVRSDAADALGKIDDERAVEPLIAALKDKEQWVRIGAASSLGMIGDKRAVEPLISLLNDERAGGSAASALGEIKDKRALEPLIKCLNHKSSWTRDCSAEALGKMKDARAVEPLIATLKVTKPRYYQRTQPTVTDERAVRDLRAILGNERIKNRHHVAWALVEIGQPAIGPLTLALQSDDKWLSGAAALILEKIQASPATEPSTGMQSQQGKVEKQLAWLASEADLVVVAENPWQYDRLYARQVLKGSKVSFSNIQEIDGIEKPPTDKNKQWILFLRIEQDHNLLLSPIAPSGWFAPYSEELAQRVIAAIPQPETWGETKDGLRMGLRLRKSHFDVGEDIPVEICIRNVSKKAVTLYQHRYNNREYDYYPFTRLVVEFCRRLELYKPTLHITDMDSPSPRTLSPGETYIHAVRLDKWTDWYEPAPKPGEKVEFFMPGTFKIICTYSVEKNPPMVPEPAHPKNAWSGTLTSAPITLKIVEAKDASAAMQPTVTERYVLNDMTVDVRKEIEKLHSPDARIRALAAMALGEMGANASPAIPHLIPLLGDQAGFDHRDVWQKATFFTVGGRSFGAYVAADATGALAKIGEPAVKPLIEALKDSNAFVRVHAARALERVQDKRAVEPLCKVLKDADENVRSAAAIALGQIGDGRAAKQLTELLSDKASRPRQDAIDALIKLDRPATKPVLTALRDWRRREYASYILAKTRDPHAVEPLLEDLKDSDPNVRQGAVVGLGALGDRRAVKPLVKLLKGPNPQVRAASVQALGLIGEVPLEVYKRALQDEEPQVRINAAMALRRTKNASATEMLVKALKDENASVRNGALLAISIRDFRAVPAIIELLRDEDEGIRTNAAFVLAVLKDQRAVKPLIEALKDKNYEVRARASYALGEIKDPQAVDVLCNALGDEKPEVRVRAAMALRNIRDKRAVVPLIEALKDPDWEVVIRTAEALGIIGDTQAVEPLISVLTDELKSPRKINIIRDYLRETTDDLPWAGTDMTVTLPVIAALGWLGDERATQPLLTALKDKRFQIRNEAAQALGNIRAQAAVAALIAALKDKDPTVRSSAARALGQIKDPRAIEALITASQDKEVSAYAISALRSITGHPDYTWEQWQRWWKKDGDRWMRSAAQLLNRVAVSSATLWWVDDETGQMLFTVRDIVRFDWEQQIFELSRRRAMDLLANQYGLSRPFRVYDSSGVIYRGTFVSSAASMTFDGPVIVVGSIIKNIQPPLFRIDGGYPQGPERDEIRFSERMKMALADAGVFCEIDLTRPPAPFTRIMSEWAGEKEGQRVLVELFPETFQIGEMARIHVHFVGGKHLSEDAHAIEVNATVKANNGEFEYTVQRIFPIGRDGWKKVYVLESMPWGPVLASPDAYAKPGPAEVSVQVSTKRTLYTKMGSYSDLINTIKTKPIEVTILPQDRDVQPTERPSAGVVPDLLRERDRLLAQADAAIRDGIVELAEKFPQLKRAKAWGSISVRSEPGRIGIYFYRTDPGSKPAVRKREDYGVMVDVRPIPSDVQEFQLGMDPIYPNLGLVGLVGAGAGDAELDAALNKLIEKALTPLKWLNEKGGIDAQLNRTFEYGVGESNEPAISDGNSLLLPGSRISIRQAVTEPEFLFAAVCEAVDEAAILGGDLGTNHAFQRFKIVELLTKEGHLPGQMIDLAYIYTNCPGLREHKIITGQQVIWLVHSPKDTSFFTGRKALVDTPQNHNVVQKAATELEQAARWKTYLLAESGHIKVKLLIKENACPSDVEWMRLEFENAGSKQVRVIDVRYVIDRVTFDLTTGKPAFSGGLVSGNTYDLFPRAWKTIPISPIFLAPGTYAVIEHPSFYSMGTLGMPDKNGWRVKGVVRFSMKLANGQTLSTPEDGVEISFNWLYPDEVGFDRMRKRLRDLLSKPDNHIQHAFAIITLLSSPQVAKSLTLGQLLDGIARREGAFDGRDELVKFVNQNFAYDPKVIDFYRAALEQNDWAAVSDLSRVATDIWDVSFVEPLVKMNKRSKGINPNHKNVLTVLSKHYSHWKNDHTVARHLSTALVKNYPELKTEPNDQNESRLIRWVNAVELLGMTHDKDMVSVLQPFLDCKTTVITYEGGAMLPRGVVPVPQRACDTAYNAIMTLLDKKQQKWNLGPGLLGNRQAWACKDQNDVRNVLRKRDELIRALEIKLTDITSERGRDSSQGDGLAAQRSGELKRLVRKAIDLPVRDARGPGKNEQNPTGLDFSRILDLTGQKTDVEGFTKDHRMYRRDVRRLVAKKKTWALCALLDHPNIDAKILAARELTYLNDPKNVPALLAAAKSNNYPVDGSENATVHANFRSILKQALQKITGLSLTPKGLKVTSYPKPSQPKVIYSDDDPSYFKEEIDFKKVESWLNTRFFDDSLPIVQKSNVQVEGEGEKNETVQSKAFTESALINALECGNSLVIAKILSVRANKETKPGKFYFYKTKVIEPIIIGDLSSTFAILYDYAAWLR